MKYWKTFSKILLSFLLFIGADKLIRTQTHGFRVEKTRSDYPISPQWEVESNNPKTLLAQPFYFLGSGVQCYAFLGEDNTTVLKLFKHYHMGPPSKTLQTLSCPRLVRRVRDKILTKRRIRIESIFSSACIAHNNLSKETQILHLNINPKDAHYPTIKLYDNIGICHQIDLNTTPFVLQKKAEPLLPYLEKNKDKAKSILNSLLACISHRKNLGILNGDRHAERNFGVIDGKVVEIDVGSFTTSPNVKPYEMHQLKKWIQKNTPELSEYFEQKYHL